MSAQPRPGRPADPVRGLLRAHRELCERAVHPLEIAAGLEAHGVTDRTAARFRHRDVFSLAEELYARAPHPGAAGTALTEAGRTENAGRTGHTGPIEYSGHARHTGRTGPGRPGDAPHAVTEGGPGGPGAAAVLLLPLLPGALCAAVLAALSALAGRPPLVLGAVAAAGAVLVPAGAVRAVRAVLFTRPAGVVSAGAHTARVPASLAVWACWLIAYALFGDWLLRELLGGGPDIPGSVPPGVPAHTVLSLALAVAPAVWCAGGFARVARRRLVRSRSLAEFAAGVRPVLAVAVLVFAGCVPLLQRAAAWALDRAPLAHAVAGGQGEPGPVRLWATAALCLLFFAATLLTAHGRGAVVPAGLGAACAAEAVALLSVLAARLPGLSVVARPVEWTVTALGAGAVGLLACTGAALALLAYAAGALTGVWAHHRAAAPT